MLSLAGGAPLLRIEARSRGRHPIDVSLSRRNRQHAPREPSDGNARDMEKRVAAEYAAQLVEDGARVGLGTGSTVAHLLPALARRRLRIRCVASSPATEQAARAHGLSVEPFDQLDRLDVTIDGADQIDPYFWLIKGGGGAHTREKILAAAADRFIVIASSNKLVAALAPPVPVEVLRFGAEATARVLETLKFRETPASPDGGLIADFYAPIGDASKLARRLADVPGVISHGLFQPALVTEVLIGRGSRVERLT